MAKKKKPAPTAPRTALVVLGMHRSGTSALAGVLAKMGADLPQDLMPANEFNPDGYFESMRAYKLNDALLGSAGSSWDDWHEINPDWYGSPRKQEYTVRAQEMLEQEFGASRFFVLKDPRVCRLVPFWSEVMAESNIEPHFVCMHRNPVEVAASLARREGWPESEGLMLWLRHVLDAEAGSRGRKRVFVSYDKLLSDSRGTIERIGEVLQLHWPIKPETAERGIKEFLSDSRRNFRAAEMEDQPQSTVLGWIGEIHGIFEGWVQGGEIKGDHKRLDEIRALLAETDATLSILMEETRRESDEARRLKSEIEKSNAKISELDAAAQTAREEAASHAANHATEQKARVAAQARIAELDTAFKTAQQRAESLQADTANERQARVAAQARVAELDTALNAAKIDAERLQAKSAQDQKAYAALQSRVEQLDSALIAARDNAKAEKQRIEAAADERYRTLEESYNALESRHDSIDQALENAKRERAQLHSQLEQSRTEADDYHRKILADEHIIGSLEAELEKIKNERNALAKITQRDGRHLASMTKMLTAQISKVVDLRLAESVVEKEHRNSNATIQSLFSRSESADALIAELDQALAASRADAEALQARNAELDQAVAASRADAEALQARNAELDQARRAAENYNQELLESTSWRITAPLRQIVRKLRGI